MKLFRAIFGIVFLLLGLFSRAQYQWDLHIKSEVEERIMDSFIDHNNVAVLCGQHGNLFENMNGLIVKIYPDGNHIEKYVSGPDTNAFFRTCVLSSDSTYVFFGSIIADGAEAPTDIWIYETDTNLNELTNKSFSGVDDFYINCITNRALEVENGNWVLASYKGQSGSYNNVWMIKLNENFDTLYSKLHVYMFTQYIDDLEWLPHTNEYMIIGSGFDRLISTYELFRMDTNLNKTGFTNIPKTPPNPYFNGSWSNTDYWLSDTSFILTFHVADTSKNRRNNHIGVFKVDTTGSYHEGTFLGKLDTLDYPANFKSMAAINQSSKFYVGGHISYLSFYPDLPGVFELYLLDTSLNTLGYAEYGWDAYYHMNGLITTPDSGCIVYGQRYDHLNNNFEYDITIVKFSYEDLDILTSTTNSSSLKDIKHPFPNPTNGNLNIPILNPKELSDIQLVIYSIQGKKVLDRPVNLNGNLLTLHLNYLPEGIYSYMLMHQQNVIQKGKFIKK